MGDVLADRRYGCLNESLVDLTYQGWSGSLKDLAQHAIELKAEVVRLRAATKAELTGGEREDVSYIKRVMHDGCNMHVLMETLLAIIDRLCPPPKDPPTDEELADKLRNARAFYGLDKHDASLLLREVEDALRARSAKEGGGK